MLAMSYHWSKLLLKVLSVCLFVCKNSDALVYCQDDYGAVQYSCQDSSYCCGQGECCLYDNGIDFLSLWYFWVAMVVGILIVGVVSGMFCKGKRHHERECRVQDVSFNNESQQANIMLQQQQQQQQHPQQAQVVVIPVMYNQPPNQGAFNISGTVPLMAPMATDTHPSMQLERGGRRRMMDQRPPPEMAQQAVGSPGEFVRPLGPGYKPPPAYGGPLPPGYVPQ